MLLPDGADSVAPRLGRAHAAGVGDTVGVRIDGEIVARPSVPATGRGARAEPDAAQPTLRRRALIALAGLLGAVLMLSGAVGQLRVHAIPGAGTAGLIRGIGPCPLGRACAISAQPSAQMWEATYRAFPDYAQIATTVVFDAQTGQSYSQSMTLRSGDIVIGSRWSGIRARCRARCRSMSLRPRPTAPW